MLGRLLHKHLAATAPPSGFDALGGKVKQSAPAATLVESVRARVKLCAGSRPADQINATIPLTKPQGVDDFYAYCETNQDPDLVDWSCHAVMGRGTLITLVVAFGLTRAAAEAQPTSVVPIFAETFAKA